MQTGFRIKYAWKSFIQLIMERCTAMRPLLLLRITDIKKLMPNVFLPGEMSMDLQREQRFTQNLLL